MNCNYFGICASCTLFDKTYEEQLNYKIQREKAYNCCYEKVYAYL